jgi:hypothetical protein
MKNRNITLDAVVKYFNLSVLTGLDSSISKKEYIMQESLLIKVLYDERKVRYNVIVIVRKLFLLLF